MGISQEWEHFAALDRRLVEAAKGIKVLSQLAWPPTAPIEFLKGWRAKKVELPQINARNFEYKDQKDALSGVMADCDRSHPIGSYIYKTANSYLIAARMLENIGTPVFTELSSELYGTPRDKIGSTTVTNLIAAEHFLNATDEFVEPLNAEEAREILTPDDVAVRLRLIFAPFFTKHKVEVVTDPNLTAKAAAGAQRVRLRGGASFSALDIGQLAQHEGFVHAASMLNGREQPYLKSLGLGAPRTTATQEGLATFAEMITNTMDVARLRRIALRIKGMHLAMEGADFIDLFEFFLKYGQDEAESFQSAARLFRGGNPRGGVVFTKDVVYLQGLMFVHTFLRKAIQKKFYHYADHLFVGRLALGDVIELEPFIISGFITPPLYRPAWVANTSCLAAYLCYSIFSNRINLTAVKLTDFSDHEL